MSAARTRKPYTGQIPFDVLGDMQRTAHQPLVWRDPTPFVATLKLMGKARGRQFQWLIDEATGLHYPSFTDDYLTARWAFRATQAPLGLPVNTWGGVWAYRRHAHSYGVFLHQSGVMQL